MTNTNTGHHNTGHYNTGNRNTGHYNTGRYNTGDCNTGDCNTGYHNTGDYNTGAFCTTTPEEIVVFNETTVGREKFYNSLPVWLYEVNPTKSDRDMNKAYAKAWEDSDKDVSKVEGILGFNREIWIEITGLDLWGGTPGFAVPTSVVVGGVTYVLPASDLDGSE